MNAMKGEATATLEDGRTIRLAFNTGAWIAAEEVLGKTTPEIIKELQSGNASLRTQRALFYGGLRKHHPEIEIEEAGDILMEAAEAMAAGLNGGMPQGEEGQVDGEAAPDPPKRGTGTKR